VRRNRRRARRRLARVPGTDLPEAEAEDPDAHEVPTVVYYCPNCAAREFGDW
jgi:hypothetical protein